LKGEIMFELMDSYSQSSAVIRVIGVGGGGGNAVEHMLANSVEGVEFVCANTDAQALRASTAHTKLQLGNDVTKGLGAGANPEVGRQSALEDRDRIQEALEGADMMERVPARLRLSRSWQKRWAFSPLPW
jgi:cell division protein FtsZ